MTDVLERSAGRRDLVSLAAPREGVAPLYETVASLLRHPRVMVIVPFVCFTLAVVAAFIRGDFTATSRITPQSSESGAASLAGVAAQFGVNMAPTRPNESVDFYADLLKSRELIDSVALARYRFSPGPGEDTLEGTYIDIYHLKGKTPFDQLFKARRKLDSKVSVSVKRTSAMVTLQTKAKWGFMAEQMNRRLLDMVNAFNLRRRQSQAHAEREFLEKRLDVVRDDLQAAQVEQRNFLERNRSYESDPRLSLQMQNLTRRVGEVQGTYAGLLQRYEQARVDEVRNTPVITIVEAPEGSRRRSRGLILAGLLGIATGLILATAIVLVMDQASKERELAPETYDNVRGLWEGLPRKLLGRGRAGSGG